MPPAQTTFDVATIRLTTEHIEFERDGETTVLHGVVRMHDVPMSACIAFAYGIPFADPGTGIAQKQAL